jgi:two-component sensor histidine kinase
MSDYFTNFLDLLSQYSEATVVENNNEIIFMNDSAKKMFAYLPVSLSGELSELLPAELIESEAMRGSGYNEIGGKSFYISMYRMDDCRVFTFITEKYDNSEDFDYISTVNESIKTPLATLYTAASIMLPIVESSGNETLSKSLAMIFKNYFKLLRLSNNIAGFNEIKVRSTRLNVKNVDLLALCRNLVNTVSLLTRERGVRIWFKTTLKRADLNADFDRLEYVLLNLLSNSLNHTGIGDDITVLVSRAGDLYIVTVSDTGTGVPAAIMPTVFEPRIRKKSLNDPEPGLGMGLAYSRHIISMHGGSMVLESREGQGTTVRFTLPKTRREAMLADSAVQYGDLGIAPVLTELSDILSLDCFDVKYLD